MVLMRFFRIVVQWMVVFGTLSLSMHCAADEVLSPGLLSPAPPRLWKAQKKDVDGRITRFYFLGATHIGLPIEYDSYFNRVVRPAFAEADILLYEGANGREPEPKPVCDPAVLTPAGRVFLAHVRRTVEQTYFRAQEAIHKEQLRAGIDDTTTAAERRKVAHNYISTLDEFDLHEIYLLYGQVLIDMEGPAAPAGTGKSTPDQVANELRRSRPYIPVRDVDSLYGAHRAYCSAGPERILFLRSALNAKNSASADYMRRVPDLEREFADILSRKKLHPDSAMNSLSKLDRTFLCGRNAEWTREISGLDDGKVHFYILGVNHLFPVNHDGVHCNGLLSDLQASGLTPEIIE